MSCFGAFWSVIWGRNITVRGDTYRVVRRVGEGGEQPSPDLLEFERRCTNARCRVLLRGTGTQAGPLLCSGEYFQATVRVAFPVVHGMR